LTVIIGLGGVGQYGSKALWPSGRRRYCTHYSWDQRRPRSAGPRSTPKANRHRWPKRRRVAGVWSAPSWPGAKRRPARSVEVKIGVRPRLLPTVPYRRVRRLMGIVVGSRQARPPSRQWLHAKALDTTAWCSRHRLHTSRRTRSGRVLWRAGRWRKSDSR